MAKLLINSDLGISGVYKAILLEGNKVYVPGITNFSLSDGAGSVNKDSYEKHIDTLPVAWFCAFNRKCTENDLPASCWVTFECGDVKRPIILGFQGKSIKSAIIQDQSGEFSESSGSSSGGEVSISINASNWLAVVTAVKEAVASQKPGYSQSGYITINVNGKSIRTRTDCSGVVSAMLQAYGAYSPGKMVGTGAMQDDPPPGFKKLKWAGWDNLQAGDILISAGHTEVYAGSGNSVYNAGGDSSINNPGATPSSHDSYTYVWRPI